MVEKRQEFIGMCSLHDITQSTAEVSYWCRNSKQGNGYMTRALKGLLYYGHRELGLTKAIISTAAHNAKSCTLAERLGFKPGPSKGDHHTFSLNLNALEAVGVKWPYYQPSLF